MRWELLFEDLEAQAEAADQADLDAEVRDRVRSEYARITILDRLRGSVGRPLDVRLRNGERERGRLRRVGADWLLIEPEPGRETLVPLQAVAVLGGVGSVGSRSLEPGSDGIVAGRLDLRHVLRAIVRDRSEVRVLLDDGALLSGVLLRVGADHVELAEQPRSVEVQLVPLAVVNAVRRFDDAVI
ncbi:MAG TPA: hypothetical protein VLR26_03735 [Frankiaceae bacterium]|nr:hypothetical protein [Frankiaceae bacterium]